MNNRISRRSIIKGAAWSIPVIATAVSLPLATASSPVSGCAELRFIGTNFTRKSLKFKVQNTGSCTAVNVSVLIVWEGGTLVVPLGDIAPHSHAPIEHQREYADAIPESVAFVMLSAVTLDGTASTEVGLTR